MPDPAHLHTQLLTLLRSQNTRLDRLYAQRLRRIAAVLKRYKIKDTRAVWKGNERVRAALEKELDGMDKAFRNFVRTGMQQGMDLSNKHLDDMAKQYTAGLELSANKQASIFFREETVMAAFLAARMKGMDMSFRVWKRGTRELVKQYLVAGLAEGRSADKISRDIRSLLRNPDKRFRRVRDKTTGKLKLSEPAKAFHPGRGVYRSSYKNALRLARNEVNIAYRHNDHVRIQNMDFVRGVRVNLSPSHPEYDICDELQGLYPKEFRFVGWHPQCICYTTTELQSREEFIRNLNGGPKARPVRRIPKRAERYIKKNTEKLAKNRRRDYWLRDNFKMRNGKLQLKKSARPK